MINNAEKPQLTIPRVTSSVLFSRVWEMPNSNTFDIKCIGKLIHKYLKPEMESIDPFANKCKLAKITNDLNSDYDTDYHLDAVDFLKQFNDIRNIVLHEDARMFMMMFKIDQIRAMITCIRICKVIMRQLILEIFPKIELGIDKGVLQYNGGLMLKSGFIE